MTHLGNGYKITAFSPENQTPPSGSADMEEAVGHLS